MCSIQKPDFATRAIYEFVRAAEVDPTLGGTADAAKITAYANTVYTGYHGSDKGLNELMDRAIASPLRQRGGSEEAEGVRGEQSAARVVDGD